MSDSDERGTVLEGHADWCPAVESGASHGLSWTRIDNGRCICTPRLGRNPCRCGGRTCSTCTAAEDARRMADLGGPNERLGADVVTSPTPNEGGADDA